MIEVSSRNIAGLEKLHRGRRCADPSLGQLIAAATPWRAAYDDDVERL